MGVSTLLAPLFAVITGTVRAVATQWALKSPSAVWAPVAWPQCTRTALQGAPLRSLLQFILDKEYVCG